MNLSYDLIADLPVFLAYSLEIEKEAAERLRLFAARMQAEGQPTLAATFERLATFSEQHANEVQAICKRKEIPLSAAEGVAAETASESPGLDEADTSMTVGETVKTMLTQERASAEFYAEVAKRTLNPEIRRFALQFAEEENEHARALEEWLNGAGRESFRNESLNSGEPRL